MEQGDQETSVMAQQNFTISPPHPFWATGSQPSMKWSEWKDYFVNYIKAVDEAGKMKPKQMKRLLLHSLGPVGLKTYNRMPKATPNEENVFEKALKDLDKYFDPKVCIGVVRQIFSTEAEQGRTCRRMGG